MSGLDRNGLDGETLEVLDLATRLAREAGAVQRDRYETRLDIQTKSASIDTDKTPI